MNNRKPYIYLVEDDEDISKLICLYLEKANIVPKSFLTAEEALENIRTDTKPDLIILDLNLPGMNGFDFLTELQKINQAFTQSVIVLSARDTDEDIIKSLDLGADEFITKPFSPSVLIARIQAILRRQNVLASSEDYILFGDYTLLLNSCVLKKGNTKIPLSTKEYEVLEYIVKNAGQVLSPEKIYQSVWKMRYGDLTAVAVYIQRLRKKIENDISNCKFIKTDFGKGYIFEKETIKSGI